MVSFYVTAAQMQRAITGFPLTPLLGVSGHVAHSVAIGDTSIQLGVGNETLDTTLDIGKQITLFDGATSEQLQCIGPINVATSLVPIQPAQYAHSVNTEYCTDGPGGSLADVLARGSAKVENYCRQSLLLQTYTEVQHRRWSNNDIRRDGGLKIAPLYWPVQSVVLWSLQYDGVLSSAFPIDVTQLVLNSATSSVLLPYLALMQSLILYGESDIGMSGMTTFGSGRGFLSTMTYKAGYAPNALPPDVEDAAILLSGIELLRATNNLGASEITLGKRKVVFRGSTDFSGISQLQKEAESQLASYQKRSHVR